MDRFEDELADADRVELALDVLRRIAGDGDDAGAELRRVAFDVAEETKAFVSRRRFHFHHQQVEMLGAEERGCMA